MRVMARKKKQAAKAATLCPWPAFFPFKHTADTDMDILM